MTNAQHTPWALAYKIQGATGANIRSSTGYLIAEIHNTHKSWEAHARLIAAAPDLLAALKECVSDMGAEDSPWFEKAQEAIAKVEGK